VNKSVWKVNCVYPLASVIRLDSKGGEWCLPQNI